MDPVDAATQVVTQRFPEAIAAFLGGSVLGAARTSTSDLDIVVIRPHGYPAYRETMCYPSWPVELFVHTPTTLQRVIRRDMITRRSPVLHMVGGGVVLVDADGTGARLKADALRTIAAGPPPVSGDELELLRYQLSDVLDDLDGATDPDEAAFIANEAFVQTARLALTVAGVWLGTGKWLGRRLRDANPELHTRLIAALRDAVVRADTTALRGTVGDVLDRAGGSLTQGFCRLAPPDIQDAAPPQRPYLPR